MADIQKTFVYKVYKAGVYVGNLPAPYTDFETSQDINTGGAQVKIGIAATLEQAGIDVSVDYLVDQLGNRIVDEVGNKIITRKDYVFTKIPIDLGNEIRIHVYDKYFPNGRLQFKGIITTWASSQAGASISVTALSYGVQLDNFLVKVSPNTAILDFQSTNTEDALFAQQGDKNGNLNYNRTVKLAQTFQVISNTTISSASFIARRPPELNNPISTTLRLYSGTPGGTLTLLETVTKPVNNTIAELTTYAFTTPRAVVTGTVYTIELTITAGIDIALLVGRDSTGSYGTGQAYIFNDTAQAYATTPGDYAFQIISASGAIGNQFNSHDPGLIMRKIITAFNQQGGQISYNDSTIDLTNTVVSYTFKFNTVLEGVNKVLQLAPSRWYWYVDPGNNLLHFHAQSGLVNRMLTKGKEIQDLDISYTLDDIKNNVYYTGGEVSGVNIVSTNIDSVSTQKYGQWLAKETDSRVTIQSTADILAANIVNENNTPRFSTEITVLSNNYDIELFTIGDIIGFKNFNVLINDLRLQVVSIKRSPYKAVLKLDTLPPAQSNRIEDIKRNLTAIETAKNPAE